MDRHALVISYHAPQPDRDSGSRRVFHFLQLLQESGWEVVVYAADGAGAAHDVRRRHSRESLSTTATPTRSTMSWVTGPSSLF